MNNQPVPADLLLLVGALLPPQALDDLGEFVAEENQSTPYGEVGPLARRRTPHGLEFWVQPYTGSPTRTDPRATIFAAQTLGVRRILNWDMGIAVNHLLRRGQSLVIVDYIDWTRHQPGTFGRALTAEMDSTTIARRPAFCPEMTAALQQEMPHFPSAVYLGWDRMRRETAAEARLFRQWGVDVIGQNMVPEVGLAQELGLCYAGLVTVAHYSADLENPLVDGAVRAGLEWGIQVLPRFLAALPHLGQCDCATGLTPHRP